MMADFVVTNIAWVTRIGNVMSFLDFGDRLVMKERVFSDATDEKADIQMIADTISRQIRDTLVHELTKMAEGKYTYEQGKEYAEMPSRHSLELIHKIPVDEVEP